MDELEKVLRGAIARCSTWQYREGAKAVREWMEKEGWMEGPFCDNCQCERCKKLVEEMWAGAFKEEEKMTKLNLNKQDRERVEWLQRKAKPSKEPFVAENDNLMFLIGLIDKQDKVIQVAKEYNLYSIADVDRKFKVVIEELEGEKCT